MQEGKKNKKKIVRDFGVQCRPMLHSHERVKVLQSGFKLIINSN